MSDRGDEIKSAFPEFNRLKQCRHGTMLYNVHDFYIGRSLDLYGEFSEGEIDLFRQVVKPGQVVLDIGANIGAHAVWFATAVGPAGKVLAFEPQRIVFQTLCANLALNQLTNVHCFQAAVGKAAGQAVVPSLDYAMANNFGGVPMDISQHGEAAPVLTIDGLQLPAIHFIKVDVEGMEQAVLEGAVQSIAVHTPVLYVENDRKEKSDNLVRFIDGLGYQMYWHAPPLYNPNNWLGNSANVFGQIASLNMLCLPKSVRHQVSGLTPVPVPTVS